MVYAITVILPFLPLPHSTHPAPHFQSQSPHHCPCPFALQVCSLTNPFTFFQSVPNSCFPSYSLQSVPLFYASGSILPRDNLFIFYYSEVQVKFCNLYKPLCTQRYCFNNGYLLKWLKSL